MFDRFLARVVQIFGNAVLLKGGLVLELRLERARATKDVDLRLVGSADVFSHSLDPEETFKTPGDMMSGSAQRTLPRPLQGRAYRLLRDCLQRSSRIEWFVVARPREQNAPSGRVDPMD